MALTRDLKVKSSGAASWGGMEMFLGNQIRPDDPRKEMVYRNFRAEPARHSPAGLDSGAQVVLNTVAVNLKDCPPFASVQGANAAHSADVEYRQAQSLLAQGSIAAARDEFQKACDDDTLPFRADSRINALIREAAADFAGPALLFCDAASPPTLGELPTAIPGGEIFYEHVHFNFDGNYRLGRAWAEKIEPLLPADIRASAANQWASQELCDQRLGLTDWNRMITLNEIIRRRRQPPLSGQAHNQSQLEELDRELAELRPHMDAAGSARARAIFTQEIQRDPNDYMLRFNYGDFLEAIGDAREAVAQWRQVGELLPRVLFALPGAGEDAGERRAVGRRGGKFSPDALVVSEGDGGMVRVEQHPREPGKIRRGPRRMRARPPPRAEPTGLLRLHGPGALPDEPPCRRGGEIPRVNTNSARLFRWPPFFGGRAGGHRA